MKTCVRLVSMPTETAYAPLGALGYCLTRTHFLDDLWPTAKWQVKMVDHRPEAKLLAVLVSILAGCRALAQINTKLRPDVALAQAWGVPQFAEQATVARCLDACSTLQVAQLRGGSERLFRRESYTLRHNLLADWLRLDIDLTALPISKHAEGSTKGKFAKKTVTAGNWLASTPHSIMKRCSRASTRAARKAVRATCPPSVHSVSFSTSRRNNACARSCALTAASAAMPISTASWAMIGRC